MGETILYPALEDNIVTSAKIAAGAVGTTDIADDAVSLAKMASGTDGNIITYDASGNPAAVATGTAGQVLTSAGAGAPPTFAAAAAGGAWTYIASGTASSSSSVDFESGITSTYDIYAVTWSGVTMSADNDALRLRFGTGGTPTYQSGTSYYTMVEKMSSFNGSTNIDRANGTDQMWLTGNVRSVGTGASSCGVVRIYNPSSTSLSTVIDGYGTGTHGGSYTKTHQSCGHWQDLTAVTAFRFKSQGAAIATGTFRLYGISNS
jgi:hypothetical protein